VDRCKNPLGRIEFLDKTGFNNPLSHLLTCCGGVEPVLEMFRRSGKKLTQVSIAGMLPDHAILPSVQEREILDWVNLCVLKNVPLSAVEDDVYRKVVKHENNYASKTVRQVILAMVLISKDMKDAGHGALMHDGWTK
jgi:hypothetical protein